MSNSNEKFFSYKDKPLVRSGNTIYYGSMQDSHVVMLQIKDTQKVGELDLPNNIAVTLMTTDPSVSPTDAVIKRSDKVGLYNAMDIADIWLTKELTQ